MRVTGLSVEEKATVVGALKDAETAVEQAVEVMNGKVSAHTLDDMLRLMHKVRFMRDRIESQVVVR